MSEILDDFGPLPELYVLKCMKQVCEGLDHAYQCNGMVHRDIKPPNILIDHGPNSSKLNLEPNIENDIAKIIDFGLAKKTDDTDNLTLTGLTVGTPHYMAPEQIRADPKIDCRADIYSLGATMYHLLTGTTPFKGNSPGAIMLAHVNDDVPDPAQIIPSLRMETIRLIQLSLAKDRDERYSNYAALKNDIDAALKARTGGNESGMRVLRKPLVVKNKVSTRKKRKSEPEMESVGPSKQAVTSRTERIEVKDGSQIERKEKGSSSMLRLVQQRLFSHKTSAAFDEDIDNSMGVSTWVWVALALSLAFMLITVVMRYA